MIISRKQREQGVGVAASDDAGRFGAEFGADVGDDTVDYGHQGI